MEVRKFVCLNICICDDGWQLPQAVSDAGWQPCQVGNVDESRALIAECHPCVGVVLFERGWLNGARPGFEAVLRDTASRIEWIGLVPEALVDNPVIRELIAIYCSDYHTLPVDGRRLVDALGHADGMSRLRQSFGVAAAGLQGDAPMIGNSPVMLRVFRQLEKIAAVDAPVMLVGESGTGKELAAQAIHQASSRAEGPFVAVNCGAIPAALIQSELFGHEKGSFTGAYKRQLGHIEAANGGTIFLDEIGDLPLALQVNLLRFLQEKTIERIGGSASIKVDARVIAATNKDLAKEVQEGRFREDLYYRLCVLNLLLPPLRERREDICTLAHHFYLNYQPHSNPKVEGFTPQALKLMRVYDWPGNVRELKNRVQRALVMCEHRLLGPQDLELEAEDQPVVTQTLAEARAEAEVRAVRAALYHSDNNIQKASRQLGVSRVTFYRMLEKYDLAAR